jgi:ATP-dependent Lon protease
MIELLDDNNKFKPNKIPIDDTIGIVNGLYATTTGSGGIVNIQIFPQFLSDNNNFNIKLTGSLGDVMKESINVAYTTAINYINNNKSKYNIDCIIDYIKKSYPYGFHVHTPAGATPKDGPSAGCAFTIAFISRILNLKFKKDVAMTGEIDLNNNITKIGGLEFKMIGAKQSGIKLVLVSSENDEDIIDIKKNYPDLFDENFNYKLINILDDAVKECLIN